MSVSLSVDGPGDAELISAVRGGDVDAYGELFARHVDAARRLARQLAGHGDADDLVSDAFTKVLTVLQRGGGPDLAFRAYLLTAVRRLHVDRIRAGSRLKPVDDLAPFDPGLPFHDTAVEGFDNAAAARAFASLPERWQMVLWHTEVEQQKPADIAPLLGMSANSVSALAYRAREGLRQAFLSQHATDPDDVDCAWTRDHLGAYVRGGLSRRDAARVDNHLAACRACAAVYLELTEVNSGLAALLAPLLLGSAGAGYLSSSGTGASVFTTGLATAKTWVAAHASVTAVGGMVVAATAVLTIYGASHLNGSHHAADLTAPQPLNRAPASALPSPGSDRNGGQHGRNGTTGNGRQQTPGPDRSTDPSTPTSSTGPSTPPVGDSTAPVVNPSGPSSPPDTQPTDPTTGPTDPTTGPTEPPPPAADLTFTSTPPQNPRFGDVYHVHATGGSGQISFSVDSGTTGDACVMTRPAKVRFDHAGRCVITAESTNRSASRSAPVTQKIDVAQEKQELKISSTGPDDAVVGGQPYTVVAEPGVTGNPVIYTTSGGCTISGDSVTFQHTDSCTVIAHQDGNHDYTDAGDKQKFGVGKGSQTISFTSTPPENPRVGGSYDVSATGGNSGQPVTFRSTTENVCTVSDESGTVTFTSRGTCTIAADQLGSDDYQDADSVTQSIVVHAALGIEAELQPGQGNQEQIVVTVSGLEPGEKATLHVDTDGKVERLGGGSCDCTLTGSETGDPVAITLQFNTQQFPILEATFTVTLADTGETASTQVSYPGQQSFAKRTQP